MSYSSSEILKMIEPWELFSNDVTEVKKQYSLLAKTWHPDLNDNSEESHQVMSKINLLYEKCLKMIEDGNWKTPDLIKICAKNNKTYQVKYRTSHSFELGTMYIADTVVLYLIDKEHENLFNNADKTINNFVYADDSMKSEFSRYLPKIIDRFETKDNKLGIVIKKTPDLVLLKDVLNYYDGKIPPRHVAWILSSLHNLACYLNHSKISHNAITLDNYFISPLYHSGALLGGWWYSVPYEDKMVGVPEKIYEIMPPQIKDTKCGSVLTDLESIRLIGRELLGDETGLTLTDIGSPIEMSNWLRGASSPTAFKDYTLWNNVLTQSFGERKFIIMELDENKLYSTLKNKNIKEEL